MNQKMKAIGLHQFGTPEVLEVVEVDKPTLTSNSVLIKVTGASVNPADWHIRKGEFKFFMSSKRPFIPGLDVAGTVVEVGTNVTHFRPGDKVFAMLSTKFGGGYAEFVAVEEKQIAKAPKNISLLEAAALPLVGETALQALRDKANLQPGAAILINGASGGVGTIAIQIAKALGAGKITAVCSQKNTALVRSLGADEVIDYNKEMPTKGENLYDIFFDATGNLNFSQVRSTLKPTGVFVTVHPFKGNAFAQFIAKLTGKRVPKSVFAVAKNEDLELLARWVEEGKLRPILDKTYPLEQVAEAHVYSESGRVRGKLVLVVAEPENKMQDIVKTASSIEN